MLNKEQFNKCLDQIYAKYDKDVDGYLNADEVTDMLNDSMKEQGKTISKREVQQFINACDQNRDGKVHKD